MLTKNNARTVAKLSRAKAEISEFILAHPSAHLASLIGIGSVGCLGLWAVSWLMYLGFGVY